MCTLNDREKLLSDIAILVTRSEESVPAARQQAENWHEESEKRFIYLLSLDKHPHWPLSFAENRYQLSYVISLNTKETPLRPLRQILAEINNKVLNTVDTGWSMFNPSGTSDLADIPEREDGAGEMVLEANVMDTSGEPVAGFWVPEFWRVAPNGCASLVRAYMEDRPYTSISLGREPGTWLCPKTVIRETAELVTHAKEMMKRFDTAATVSFRCAWIGLENRRLANFDGSEYFHSHEARVDKRIVEKTFTVTELEAMWSTVVSELSEPVLRLFGFEYCSPEFVKQIKPEFIRP